MTPEQEAMDILMTFSGGNQVTILDSGGKDSSVLKRIAEKCRSEHGLDFKIVHNHTSIDAPETVYFIRREREREMDNGIPYEISYPKVYFDQLCLEKRMLPTRIARFCCNALKESYGERGERLVTGVRKAESTNRKNNQGILTILPKSKNVLSETENDENFTKTRKGGVVLLNYDNDETRRTAEKCIRTGHTLINPLINWTDEDVWRYIRDENIPLNPLYECGFNRVGCVGCPMAQFAVRQTEFARYPKYRDRFIRIAERIVEAQKKRCAEKGIPYTGAETGLKYFKRWLEDPNVDGQFSFDTEGNITEDYT